MKKCCYKNCLVKTEIDEKVAIRVGNKYYHPECLKTKEQIDEIIKLWAEKINEHVVYSQLRSVINNIIFTKGVSSDYLLFGLKYYIFERIPLNYPQGLHYVIQNKDVEKAYAKYNVKKMDKPIEVEQTETVFTYKPTKSKTLFDLLGG